MIKFLMLDVEMRDSGTQDQEVTDVIDLEDSDVIDLEDSDSDEGEVNGADLANIAVDLSDEDGDVIDLEDSDSDEGEVNGADLANVAVDKMVRMVNASRLLLRPFLKWNTAVMERHQGRRTVDSCSRRQKLSHVRYHHFLWFLIQ